MDLLKDEWIPTRPQQSGQPQRIDLKTLLCRTEHWELALPRDDMEMAALQLLICLVQIALPPADERQWRERIAKPIDDGTLNAAIEPYSDWFQLDHPDFPFMQIPRVHAKEITPMEKLLPGLDTSTEGRFVNAPDMAIGLCGGCTAIALYNQANNAPSFGGGFKFGLRGTCPVSTFAQGDDLRTTIWLNTLSLQTLSPQRLTSSPAQSQPPTWVEPIKEKTTIPATSIGLLRGLFWQPSHVKLSSSEASGQCSCCGQYTDHLYTGFYKAKFNYTIDGLWLHPHSPQSLSIKKGSPEIRYVGFTQPVPTWTQLSRYVVKRDIDQIEKGEQGQKPALVIQQLQKYLGGKAEKFELLAGGYRNNKAAVVERRHEVLTLSKGWERHTADLHQLLNHALAYRTALRKKLFVCSRGIKEKLKGAGLDLHELGETLFYRRTENLMLHHLAEIDFENVLPTYLELDKQLGNTCREIFDELTAPYQHDPELFRTITINRRSLQKELKENRYNNPEEDAA